MHLVFPNGEHEKIQLSTGTFSIGAAETCDITLASDGMLDNHAMIAVDHRGITLVADSDALALTVNERPVAAKSILRLGDHVKLGEIDMGLLGDARRLENVGAATGKLVSVNRDHPPRFLIRGLNGALSGQAIALYDHVTLGSADADVPLDGAAADIQVEETGIYLRNASGIEVNGHPVSDGQLAAGDQLVAGAQRFLLEAPGFVPGKAYSGVAEAATGSGNTQVFTAPVIDAPADEPPAPEAQPDPPREADHRRRDAIIVAVCLVLSAAMIGWLLMNYLS
ncbi:MAG: FHA domain-containing protein [Pseudomonadota bacterium]